MSFKDSNFSLFIVVILLITSLLHCERLNDIKVGNERNDRKNLLLKVQTEYKDNFDFIYLVTVKDNYSDSLDIKIYREDLLNFTRHEINKHPLAKSVSVYFYEFGNSLPPKSYFKDGWNYQEVLNIINTHSVTPVAKYFYDQNGNDTIQLY